MRSCGPPAFTAGPRPEHFRARSGPRDALANASRARPKARPPPRERPSVRSNVVPFRSTVQDRFPAAADVALNAAKTVGRTRGTVTPPAPKSARVRQDRDLVDVDRSMRAAMTSGRSCGEAEVGVGPGREIVREGDARVARRPGAGPVHAEEVAHPRQVTVDEALHDVGRRGPRRDRPREAKIVRRLGGQPRLRGFGELRVELRLRDERNTAIDPSPRRTSAHQAIFRGHDRRSGPVRVVHGHVLPGQQERRLRLRPARHVRQFDAEENGARAPAGQVIGRKRSTRIAAGERCRAFIDRGQGRGPFLGREQAIEPDGRADFLMLACEAGVVQGQQPSRRARRPRRCALRRRTGPWHRRARAAAPPRNRYLGRRSRDARARASPPRSDRRRW